MIILHINQRNNDLSVIYGNPGLCARGPGYLLPDEQEKHIICRVGEEREMVGFGLRLRLGVVVKGGLRVVVRVWQKYMFPVSPNKLDRYDDCAFFLIIRGTD